MLPRFAQSGLTAGGLRDFEGRARSDIQAVGVALQASDLRRVERWRTATRCTTNTARCGEAKTVFARFRGRCYSQYRRASEERISSMRTLADARSDGTFDVPQSSAPSRLSQYFDRPVSVRPEAVVSTVVLFIFAIVAARVHGKRAWCTMRVISFGAPNPWQSSQRRRGRLMSR